MNTELIDESRRKDYPKVSENIFYVGRFENNNVCSKLGCTIFVLLKNEFPYFVPAITASLSHYGFMKHPLYGGDMIQLIDL